MQTTRDLSGKRWHRNYSIDGKSRSVNIGSKMRDLRLSNNNAKLCETNPIFVVSAYFFLFVWFFKI